MTKKATTGRQKIPIAKIKNENHRQVTFSKRRAGLFKKASELCTLCGVETAIVVFSPAGKPFSFGHPSVESVVNKYISNNNLPIPHPEENHRNAGLREMNLRLTQVSNDLEAEKKKGIEIENIRKANRVGYWWERPVEEMNLGELEQLQVALEDLKMNLKKQIDETQPVLNTTPVLEGRGDFFNNFGRKVNVMNPSFSTSFNFPYGPTSYMFDSRV